MIIFFILYCNSTVHIHVCLDNKCTTVSRLYISETALLEYEEYVTYSPTFSFLKFFSFESQLSKKVFLSSLLLGFRGVRGQGSANYLGSNRILRVHGLMAPLPLELIFLLKLNSCKRKLSKIFPTSMLNFLISEFMLNFVFGV